MRVEQLRWTRAKGWTHETGAAPPQAQLVLAFGGTSELEDLGRYRELQKRYPKAHVLGCSTAGEILGTHVTDNDIVATAVQFDHSRLATAEVDIDACRDSADAGERLAQALDPRGLVHVVVISDGQQVNGSELSRGLQKALPAGVSVTGGLAGDGARFQRTLAFGTRPPKEGRVAVLGLYGDRLRIGYGSLGGWDPFGPQRVITRSKGNVLYEFDGQPALALYKKYLGEHAAGLPATGLLFPLSIESGRGGPALTRTILSVNEKDQSLTFAGDVPQGAFARLMKANFNRLVDGAHGAAEKSHRALGASSPDLALLISCVGRKLVLKQRTEEELDAVREVIGPNAAMTGFYSYGEICPTAPNANCELHNQTMTITTISEVPSHAQTA